MMLYRLESVEMNVHLKPELERFVAEQVEDGRYASTQEAIEAGIARLMLDPESDVIDEEDVAAIKESERQIALGQGLDWKSVSAELRKKHRL
jgi:putative addiction module CopG family antidote